MRRHGLPTTSPVKPCAMVRLLPAVLPIAAICDMRCQSRNAVLHQDGHRCAVEAPSWALPGRKSNRSRRPIQPAAARPIPSELASLASNRSALPDHIRQAVSALAGAQNSSIGNRRSQHCRLRHLSPPTPEEDRPILCLKRRGTPLDPMYLGLTILQLVCRESTSDRRR
jgi:hypothetical protein